mmetsp:Transcript_2785/g.7305  ORF Transcript_2785/g.7305 Transcript_2785/m.7305 type:complete len:445 (-) Transcript_2785:11-1345(-)
MAVVVGAVPGKRRHAALLPQESRGAASHAHGAGRVTRGTSMGEQSLRCIARRQPGGSPHRAEVPPKAFLQPRCIRRAAVGPQHVHAVPLLGQLDQSAAQRIAPSPLAFTVAPGRVHERATLQYRRHPVHQTGRQRSPSLLLAHLGVVQQSSGRIERSTVPAQRALRLTRRAPQYRHVSDHTVPPSKVAEIGTEGFDRLRDGGGLGTIVQDVGRRRVTFSILVVVRWSIRPNQTGAGTLHAPPPQRCRIKSRIIVPPEWLDIFVHVVPNLSDEVVIGDSIREEGVAEGGRVNFPSAEGGEGGIGEVGDGGAVSHPAPAGVAFGGAVELGEAPCPIGLSFLPPRSPPPQLPPMGHDARRGRPTRPPPQSDDEYPHRPPRPGVVIRIGQELGLGRRMTRMMVGVVLFGGGGSADVVDVVVVVVVGVDDGEARHGVGEGIRPAVVLRT